MADHCIPPEHWARDHYSTLAYAMHCIGTNKGTPKSRHMRTAPGGPKRGDVRGDWALHLLTEKEGYPTRLKGGKFVCGTKHDDWACLEDCEAVGILVNVGTGLIPRYVCTDEGFKVGSWVKMYMDTRDNGRGANTMTLEWSRVLEETGFDQKLALEQAAALGTVDLSEALRRAGAEVA